MQLNTNLPKHDYTDIKIWSDLLGNKSHVGDQPFHFWSRKSEVGSQKSEVASCKSQVGSRKSEVPPRLSYFTPTAKLYSAHCSPEWFEQNLAFRAILRIFTTADTLPTGWPCHRPAGFHKYTYISYETTKTRQILNHSQLQNTAISVSSRHQSLASTDE